ncbi:MAG: hypothetical protein HY042_05500, partial [Spirochaetia bacterium]|nr:hypothetical protein [Spirochaetia bacterium]
MSARRALEGIVAGLSATALVVLFAIGNISVGTLITGVLADLYPAFSPYGGYAFKLAMSFTFVIPIAGILAVLALLRPRFIVEALVGRPLPTSFFYYIAAGVALPFSFLVLGTEAETLGKLAYPNETLYRQLMSMIKPSGHPL